MKNRNSNDGNGSKKRVKKFAPESVLPKYILAATPATPPKPAGRRPYKSKRLTIQLAPDKFDKIKGTDSLGILLQQALDAVEGSFGVQWLIRLIVRGGLEEIIRTGHLPLPHEVTFTAYWTQRVPGFRFQSSRN